MSVAWRLYAGSVRCNSPNRFALSPLTSGKRCISHQMDRSSRWSGFVSQISGRFHSRGARQPFRHCLFRSRSEQLTFRLESDYWRTHQLPTEVLSALLLHDRGGAGRPRNRTAQRTSVFDCSSFAMLRLCPKVMAAVMKACRSDPVCSCLEADAND